MTHRTVKVLSVIASRRGLSNVEISERVGIPSRADLKDARPPVPSRLMMNTGEGQAMGGPNAWHLTPRGKAVERAFKRESLDTGR